MSRGRGLLPSTPGRIAHRLGANRHPLVGAALAAGIRGAADLADFFPSVMDQGNTSTCHAHSAAAAVYAAFAARGRPLPLMPSPLLIASTTYADVRARVTPPGATLPELQDTGAELQDDADALRRWGVAPIGPNVGGRFSDVPDDTGYGFPEPIVAKVQVAGEHLIGGEYSIPVDSSAPETCAAALDAGIPIWLGTLVGRDFEALGIGGLAQPTPDSDKSAGGHALVLSGYRLVPGAGYQWRVRNSWGTSWGEAGSVWASNDWLLACWTLWPMAVAG